MSDITKEEAITTLQSIKSGFEKDEWMKDDVKALEMGIEALKNTSIQENRGSGNWIDYPDGRWIYAQCSECKSIQDVKSNFCPECGVKMENKQ